MLRQIKEQVTACDFPIYFVPLLSYINNPSEVATCLTEDPRKLCLIDSDLSKLRMVVDKKTNLTNYTDVLQIYT